MMRIALCNEVIAPMPFPRQCEYAAKLGYDGLEIAPYTLSDEPHRLGSAQLAAARAAAEDAGIAVTGLHWLLVKPAGLSISTRDETVRRKTVDIMRALIDQCVELGGRYLVHGSPHQRRVDPGDTRAAALARARESFAAVAAHAQRAGVVYCIEALSAEQTPLINTLAEAAQLVAEIGSPAVRSMLDCSAAGRMEKEPLPALIDAIGGPGTVTCSSLRPVASSYRSTSLPLMPALIAVQADPNPAAPACTSSLTGIRSSGFPVRMSRRTTTPFVNCHSDPSADHSDAWR